MESGLSSEEVQQRLTRFGYNELSSSRPKSIWRIALEVMREPMFVLLISCGALYMLLGDYREGIVLLSTITIIIFITFYQYQKTEKALDALKRLASPRALVLRNGAEQRIAGREVVPDDVLILHEGDRIAADARIFDTTHLAVDESMLTGESMAVTKAVSGRTGGQDMVYAGTLVVQGKARARVTATGAATRFGSIGASLESIGQQQTRLQAEMKVLIRNLFIGGGIISIGVVAAFYFSRGHFVQSLLNGLAAAMALLPEEFPVVLTVFLALGAWRLSKINVLTRNPSAIETLGSATVLCTDKTGTLTQNKMEVIALYTPEGPVTKKDFEASKKKVGNLLNTGWLASQPDSMDPMERAITSLAGQLNSVEKEQSLVKEYPLSTQLMAMTRVVRAGDELLACAKGAPEAIFKLCHLTGRDEARHQAVFNELAGKGYRVIGVAQATLPHSDPDTLPERQEQFHFAFEGLIAFEDPIRAEVPDAIRQCEGAGIRVIMITGDFPTTAKSIAGQIGLSPGKQVISGDELSRLDDEELRRRISGVNIFARVVPEQKLRIVEALKANGEIVAMTGDGVNDAPALKSAQIGIAMGNKGTDVAREASSLVLLNDNFASIVSAIRSGRRIFDNLQKAMSYILAIHIPIIGLTLLPAFIPSLPLLLMPLHIVFLELIIDPVCSVAFESEKEEKGIMNRPPRSPEEKFFGWKKVLASVSTGVVLLAMVMAVYFLSIGEGHTEGEVRAIAFSSLIIGNVFLILTKLSTTRSFFAVVAERNFAVIFILSGAMALLVLSITVPGLQQIFNFEFPGFGHFLSSISGALVVLAILEISKYMRRRKNESAAINEKGR